MTEYLKQVNEVIKTKVQKILDTFADNLMSIEDIIDVENEVFNVLISQYSSFFEDDIDNFIDINLNISLNDGVIIVYPANFFTALLMNGTFIDKSNIDNVINYDFYKVSSNEGISYDKYKRILYPVYIN